MDSKNFLQQVLSEWEWDDDKVESSESSDYHFIATKYAIDENTYRLYIEGYDHSCLIKLFLYSPINIPDKRISDCCVLLNRLNLSRYSGHLELVNGSIRFTHVVDTEGFDPEVILVKNMLIAGATAFKQKVVEAIGAVAFTKLSVEEIIAQFEAPDEEDSSNVPDQL